MTTPTYAQLEGLMQEAVKLVHRNPDVAPFGAVIATPELKIVAASVGTGNESDPLAHSETCAITAAAKKLGSTRGLVLVSTHEPCTYCAAATHHAGLSVVAWGSERSDFPGLFRQKRFGAVQILNDTAIPPRIYQNVLWEECVHLMSRQIPNVWPPSPHVLRPSPFSELIEEPTS